MLLADCCGFTFLGYRNDACYYESIIMMRKLAMVVS
jgi:hypothetical protein